MRAACLAMLLLAASGCEGRATPGAPTARDTASVAPVLPGPCPPGEARRDGACVAARDAYATGRTVHVDQNHPLASDAGPGSPERPWATIGRAAQAGALQPGDAVLIRAGIYRESVRPKTGGTGPEARVTYAAYPGETVVVTGADRADTGWTRLADGSWRRIWTGPSLPSYDADPVFRRELVVAAGVVLRAVSRRADLQPGTFYAEGPDTAPTAIVARFPGDRTPAQAGPVEIAHRTALFSPEGPNPYADCGDPATPGWIRLVGLTFRHASNRAQWGAICAGSRGGLVEDVTVEWTNGQGVDGSGRDHQFLRVRSNRNGQLGWGASCVGCLFEDTAAIGNNWKGYDPFWEAGGGKWNATSNTTIRRHYAAGNAGPGIWLDGGNANNLIEGCLAVDNEVAGIMLELETTGTTVQHNVVARTRWRDWSGAGLLSQAASDNVIAFNTFVENEGMGVWLRLDPDRRAPDGRTTVVGNYIAGNVRRPGIEAREVAVEGTSPAHVRSNRFSLNAYGRHDGDPVLRSVFFAYPTPQGDYRGHSLAAWSAQTGDRQSVMIDAGDPPPALHDDALRVWRPQPAASGPVPLRVGADPTRVRFGGDWRSPSDLR